MSSSAPLAFQPQRLTFVRINTCYVCNAANVRVWAQYYYPDAYNMEGWLYCDQCKPTMELLWMPQVYERNGELPPSCFRSVDTKAPFAFDRVSTSQPHRNGRTPCTLASVGPLVRLREGRILITVEWVEEEERYQKRVPLETIRSAAPQRWPTPQSFLDEFHIDPKEPMVTIQNVQNFNKALRRSR